MASSDLVSKADAAQAELQKAWTHEKKVQAVHGTERHFEEWSQGKVSGKRFFPPGPPYTVRAARAKCRTRISADN